MERRKVKDVRGGLTVSGAGTRLHRASSTAAGSDAARVDSSVLNTIGGERQPADSGHKTGQPFFARRTHVVFLCSIIRPLGRTEMKMKRRKEKDWHVHEERHRLKEWTMTHLNRRCAHGRLGGEPAHA